MILSEHRSRRFLKVCWFSFALLLSACGTSNQQPKPADLPPATDLIGINSVWTNKISPPAPPLEARVVGNKLAVAASNGSVVVLDTQTGADLWRVSLGMPLNAGIGFDGKLSAVITRDNELIVMDEAKESWRQRLSAQSYTAPFIAGGRVFVLMADRSVIGFDAQTGRRLWQFSQQQRSNDALVLSRPGVMLAVSDTLVVGLSGKLLGLNPLNGTSRWETVIAAPRGTNDVERLVDLVGPAYRDADVLCVRSFEAGIGCVNAVRGSLIWRKTVSGSAGLQGDDKYVFGVEGDGTLTALRRGDGEKVWTTDTLRFRRPGSPMVAGRSVVLGDSQGYLHFISREDGATLARVTTDNSGILLAPLMSGTTLIAVTRNGGIYGFRPK